MKKKFILYFLLINLFLAFILIVHSQSRIDVEPNVRLTNDNVDLIDIAEFDIQKRGLLPDSLNTIRLNQTSFLQKFGLPLEKKIMYSEIDETNMDHLVYNGLDVWFINNNFESLSLNSKNYCLIFLNGIEIKVGDDVSSIINLFPKSWLNKRDDLIFVGLKDKVRISDMNLIFELDLTTNLISGIHFEY